MVAVVGVPVALAAYTGSYAPTQAVSPRQLSMPASFACTDPGGDSVRLSWTDTDATTANPNTPATFVIDGYQVDRKVGNGAWTPWATPSRTATSVTDSSFGGLSLGTQISYRMRSAKSTNWVSPDTAAVTATVTSLLIFVHVSCP
ncbi:MAG: hypothetical protein QOE58_1296 [Actinomycetota bacterium]|nr:hypothetical protein [Actinomycetota bacterium]